MKVASVAKTNVVTCTPGASLREAVELMLSRGLARWWWLTPLTLLGLWGLWGARCVEGYSNGGGFADSCV